LAAFTDLLVGMGADIGPQVAAWLDGARANQQRALLSLLAKLGTMPDGFDLPTYAQHPEASVRREALRALIRDAARRDEAIAAGLGDSDERIVRMALGTAMQNCPPKAARALIARAGACVTASARRGVGQLTISRGASPGVFRPGRGAPRARAGDRGAGHGAP
jgi:hypothetical protein